MSQPYPGFFYTGDGAARDEHGYIWIKGRVDGTSLSQTRKSFPFAHLPPVTFRRHQCLWSPTLHR